MGGRSSSLDGSSNDPNAIESTEEQNRNAEESEEIETMPHIIHNWFNKDQIREIDHGEDLQEFAAGAFSKSGNGYCLKCAIFVNPEDLQSYIPNKPGCGIIICDNCGRDSERDTSDEEE
jgi:hypothetical protein